MKGIINMLSKICHLGMFIILNSKQLRNFLPPYCLKAGLNFHEKGIFLVQGRRENILLIGDRESTPT